MPKHDENVAAEWNLIHEQQVTEGLKQTLIRLQTENERRQRVILMAQLNALGLPDVEVAPTKKEPAN